MNDIVESNKSYPRAAHRIQCILTTSHKCMAIEVRVDQIQNVQNPFQDADPVHAVDLKTSIFRHFTDLGGASFQPLLHSELLGNAALSELFVAKKG